MQFLRRAFIPVFLLAFVLTLSSCAQENNENKTDNSTEVEENISTPNDAQSRDENVPSQAENDPSGIKWVSLEEAQKIAESEDKKVLIFGYADWCPYCMQMRKETYIDEDVQERLYEHFIPVQLNAEVEDKVTFNGETYKSWELAQIMQLTSYPMHYFVNPDGQIIGAQPGFLPKEVFGPLLSYIGNELFGEVDFEEYLEETENVVIEE